MRPSVAILAFAVAIGIASSAGAERRLIPFQGRLTDESGANPRSGTFSITFSIYDAATGGAALWSETHQNVSLNNGLINVLLGKITDLDDPDPGSSSDQPIRFDDASGPYFLGVRVGTGQEMVPRHQLVPAFHARTADKASLALSLDASAVDAVGTVNLQDQAVTDSKLRNGAVTGDKIGSGAITSDKIGDGAVGMNDLAPAIQALLTKADRPPALVDVLVHSDSGITMPAVSTFTEIASPNWVLTNLASGNVSGRVPCVTPTRPSGANCDTATEVLGVNFPVTNPGLYEACVTMLAAVTANGPLGSGTNGVAARFDFHETSDIGELIGTPSVPTGLTHISATSSLPNAVSYVAAPVTMCHVFKFVDAGSKTIRIRSRDIYGYTPQLTEESDEGVNVHIWVKELR